MTTTVTQTKHCAQKYSLIRNDVNCGICHIATLNILCQFSVPAINGIKELPIDIKHADMQIKKLSEEIRRTPWLHAYNEEAPLLVSVVIARYSLILYTMTHK